MDPLDETIREALGALEAQATPRDYFEELPGKVDARLAEERMEAVPSKDENSGLHDIKALAQSQRMRISRRQTSQHDVEDAMMSSSQSGMRVIALPDPAKIVSLPSPEEARAMAIAAEAPARAAIEAGPGKKKGVPAWMFVGGGLAAAAAAVLAFVAIGGGGGQGTAAEGKADQARAAGSAAASGAGSASASASAAAAPAMEAAKQPAPTPTVEPLTVTGIASASDVGAGSGTASASASAAAAEVDDNEPAPKAEDHKHAAAHDSSGTVAKPKDSTTQVQTTTSGGAATGNATKTTDSGKGAGTGKKDDLDGAVLSAGDKDELGIGDVMNDTHKKQTGPTNTELSDKDMRAGLAAIEGKAKSCYDKYQITGTAKVKLSIDPSGHVSKAAATGDFAGTPTGDCVVAAVKTASFPPWTGGPTSTIFVVLLSD